MKTKLLVLILALSSFIICAQNTSVPDVNFELALISLGHDVGPTDGFVPTANISGVTSLNISGKNISDLTGIEDFTALQILDCSFNSFSTLMLPSGDNLLELVCQGPNITNIDAVTSHPALTKIDIRFGNVSSLNLNANINLEYLDCYDNSISTLNLLNNSALTYLDCYRNGLSTLDLSGNVNLETLICRDNNLSMLNLTNNTSLVFLNCSLCVNLTSLTLPDTPTLVYIDGYQCNSLTALDTSKNPNLNYLDVHSSGLQNTLDLTNNTVLSYLDCHNNSLNGLTLPNSPNLSEIYCNNNMIPSLNLGGCTGLTRLECHYNDLAGLVLSSNTMLTYLECHNNEYLPDLDVSSNTMLEELYCHHNDVMTSITFNNPVLKYIYCNNSPMLTVLNNTLSLAGLIDFGLWNCDLTTLDLTNSMVLQYVEPGNNYNLNSLTLPETTTLTDVWAYRSNLSSLDFTKNTGLQWLDLGINNFTSMDVSMLPNLLGFYCNENQLTFLDLKSGFSTNILYFWGYDNTALSCIQVDDVTDANNKTIANDWRINGSEYYDTNCPPLSTEEFNFSSISIYPNPTKGNVTISLNSSASFSLVSMLGQEIEKGTFTFGDNTLDISNISKGLYVLNVKTGNGKVTKKVVKH